LNAVAAAAAGVVFVDVFAVGRPTPKGHHKNVNNIPQQQPPSTITTSIRDKRAEIQGARILTRKGKGKGGPPPSAATFKTTTKQNSKKDIYKCKILRKGKLYRSRGGFETGIPFLIEYNIRMTLTISKTFLF